MFSGIGKLWRAKSLCTGLAYDFRASAGLDGAGNAVDGDLDGLGAFKVASCDGQLLSSCHGASNFADSVNVRVNSRTVAICAVPVAEVGRCIVFKSISDRREPDLKLGIVGSLM